MAERLSIFSQDKRPTVRDSILVGEKGERLAVNFLEQNGYRIVLTNFKVPVGRNSKGVQVTGEIDIIAFDGETLCFIEVKTRSSDNFADPLSAVDRRKQRQITRTSRVYRRMFNIRSIDFRFDVVTVLMPTNAKRKVKIIKGFWNESVFRKRRWHQQVWQDNF